VKFGNIAPYGKVDAYFGRLGRLMIILLEPPPHLASLHSNYGVVSRGIISGAVEQIGSNAALLQQFAMPAKLMLDNVGEKLFTAAAISKGRAGKNVFQLFENCRFVHDLDYCRTPGLGIHARDRLGRCRHRSTS
jgi:hypothetical protein